MIGTLIFYLTDLIGISTLGLCGFKMGTGLIFLDFAMTLVYFVVMVTCSIMFLKYLKSASKLDNNTKIYFKFYFRYLIISALAKLIGLISLVIVTIKCLINSSDGVFVTFCITCNLSRLILPLIVFIITMTHPDAKLSSFFRFF